MRCERAEGHDTLSLCTEAGIVEVRTVLAIQLSELRREVDEAPHVNAFIPHFDLRGALGATLSTIPERYFGGTVQ